MLPGWKIGSATLAAPGALTRAMEDAIGAPLVYPLFMTSGWFTREALPSRLRISPERILAPLGSDPALPALAARLLCETAHAEGWEPDGTEILLAAHGSATGRRPAECTRRFAQALAAEQAFAAVHVGFLEEEPRIDAIAAGIGHEAICLPYFAAVGAHVKDDLPAMLHAGGFRGRLVPPVAQWRVAPSLIAAALTAAATSEQAA